MNIGKSIHRIRTENNMSQEEFSKIFFVTRQTVSNWENEKSYPDLNTIVKISDRFGVSLDKLLKEDEEMVNDISEKTAVGIKWNKIRRTVFIVISIVLIGMVLFLTVQNVTWHIRKDKLESHFNDSVASLGFAESDERYYIMNSSDGVTYKLPHQEMPPFWEFPTDFHAKHLECCYENNSCEFNIRISGDMYSLRITKKNDEDYYVRINEDGSVLSDEDVPESVEKQYSENAVRIRNIIKNGISIYKQVYAE